VVTVPQLTYGSKAMHPEPVNMTMQDLVHELAGAEDSPNPVIVELEPGDGTYYNLLIVPAWHIDVGTFLGRYGIQVEEAERYLIVTKLDDQQGRAFYATKDVGEWDLHGIENDWTRELLVWWLKILWGLIEEART